MPGRRNSRIAPIPFLGGLDGIAHQRDLFRRLDLSGLLHQRESVMNLEILVQQRLVGIRSHAVNADPPVAACVFAHQIGDFPREHAGMVHRAAARREIRRCPRRPPLADTRIAFSEVGAVPELEEDRRTFRSHEAVADLVVQAPHLHVGRINGIAHVELIEEQDAGKIAQAKLAVDVGEAVTAHLIEIDRCLATFHGAMLDGLGG